MKMGYNKRDITPTQPVHIAGFNRQDKSIGVLDPIEINTLVLSINHQIFILSILDSIIIEDSVIQPVKEAVMDSYHIQDHQIIIGCIHTHSAPAYFKPFFEDVEVETQLQHQLIPQFISSINKAMASLTEVDYSLQKVTIDGLYGNRNTMNGHSNKDIIAIHFLDKDTQKSLFSLLSMACHPTILDGKNLQLSADLFGSIRQKFQKKYHHQCMIVNGCCGDISTRFYRQLSGEKELERVSREIIDQMDNFQDIHYETDHMKFTQVLNHFVFDGRNHDFTQSMIPELQDKIEHSQDLKEKLMDQSLLKSLNLKVKLSPMHLTLKSNIVSLGHILFISLPGDITAILGKRIQEAFPDYLVILIGYCENYSNYFVCEEDYGFYFETYISRLNKGDADLFIQNIISQTQQIL